ncbi:MAG: DUF1828 domain-containing protein [Thermoleophilia bacterium]|nr:DUF1828 domain-containing protein [Thermoleophilia bacterium]
MPQQFERLPLTEFMSLCLGEPAQIERIRREARLAAETPFTYPGKGPVVVFIMSNSRGVRLSEGGRLLRYLESQGMDLAVDPVLSKTVFHALKETKGAGVGGGEIFLDSDPDRFAEDVWRFLQIILEVVGLRHSKYKDALVQLSRAGDRLHPSSWDDPS